MASLSSLACCRQAASLGVSSWHEVSPRRAHRSNALPDSVHRFSSLNALAAWYQMEILAGTTELALWKRSPASSHFELELPNHPTLDDAFFSALER